jgi:maltose alpha-D-glucosyltransferase/alpha-amylase
MNADAQWYKDAIIYQLHVKAFFDSNNDGIGDFKGLTSKLDYIQELGVNTIWLLPFYPSPLKDDGYDIADYRNVHPSYGTVEDFREFVREAHARDLRVITELVINHTSDQHPWFQKSREAEWGSEWHDFYVWSDTDQRYDGTRIIFSDTEISNWAWDPVKKAYYWHRFFSHQPDLNFDNPKVLEEVIETMYFWLDMGVDGLRLDAVPYLCEREGTNNENLPETHDILKKIRAALDARYPDRMLLAEANQWPEDVLAYFGEGDECHMAFHFPLMPRIYMAVAQEDRHPIVDIMQQTPEIPENCQWATFLRNHDELTLEMVTDRERDYMWNFYAAERQARINFGIRRRLAPLMENDRRRIELLNSLLMSMPGTPVIYYGDEIGMGDNIFAGDRNGVRTPMQWTPDRNGGFSLADPSRLYLPPIMSPTYGYQGLNVEAQRYTRNSLLNWMRQLITSAKGHRAFSRGKQRFLHPGNRKVLAYIREYEDEKILCVANLSRSPQPCELDLKELNGTIPFEMLGQSRFPAIGELPYFLTLPAYGFFWFDLKQEVESANEEQETLPNLMTLVIPMGWSNIFHGSVKTTLEQEILPAQLMKERWYGAKAYGRPEVEIYRHVTTESGRHLVLLRATPPGQQARFILTIWNIAWETQTEDPYPKYQRCTFARVRQTAKVGLLHEATHEDDFVRELVQMMAEGKIIKNTSLLEGEVTLRFVPTQNFPQLEITELPIKSLRAEQSNTSILIGQEMILKIIRQPQAGISPEVEIGHFLTEISPFPNTPALYGIMEMQGLEEGALTVGIIQQFVPNQGDGWKITLEYLARFVEGNSLMKEEEREKESVNDKYGYYKVLAHQLGVRTAEMHQCLATTTGNADFDPEPVTSADRTQWLQEVQTTAEQALEQLNRVATQLSPEEKELCARASQQWPAVQTLLESLLPKQFRTRKTRLHGDYHLGQVLLAKNDFYLIDFEGEPARSLDERRRKRSPLKDVAGMMRSFDYAAATALQNIPPAFAGDRVQLRAALESWRNEAMKAFLTGYFSLIQPDAATEREMKQLISFYLLEKAFYEILYEAQNRPQWIDIPLQGLLSLVRSLQHENPREPLLETESDPSNEIGGPETLRKGYVGA